MADGVVLISDLPMSVDSLLERLDPSGVQAGGGRLTID